MDHLREIYMDHAKTTIAVLLYLVTFGLHQASLKVDDQLALMHYHDINETWSNVRIQYRHSEETCIKEILYFDDFSEYN